MLSKYFKLSLIIVHLQIILQILDHNEFNNKIQPSKN